MKINADFNQRVVVHSASMGWIDSPMPGVARRPLDRVGDEVARATSIVRYAPNSKFSPHVHTGGEEFVVLEGVFQDEHGDYPIGSYIRNPPQSSHTPGSEKGCVIFVKLWQFQPDDRHQVSLNSNSIQELPHSKLKGVHLIPLHIDSFEEVSIQTWDADAQLTINADNGVEILVLEGEFTESGDTLVKHSWLRLPIGSTLNAQVGSHGAKVWIKQNHLPHVDAQIERVKNISDR